MENKNLRVLNLLTGASFELKANKAPEEIIMAVKDRSFPQFINQSENPEHLMYVLRLKAGSNGYPSKTAVKRKAFFISFASTSLFFLKGRKGLQIIKAAIIKSNLKIRQL